MRLRRDNGMEGREKPKRKSVTVVPPGFKSPPGGVLFWLSRHKKEPKNVGSPAWPRPSPAKNLINSATLHESRPQNNKSGWRLEKAAFAELSASKPQEA